MPALMKEQIEILIQIAVIDKEIDALVSKKENLPKIIREISLQISQKEKIFAEQNHLLANLETSRRFNEAAIADKLGWSQTRETKLKDIKTNREYHAAVKEIEETKKMVGRLEEETLELIGKIEVEKPKAVSAKSALEIDVGTLKNELTDRAQEGSVLDAQIAALEIKRLEIEAGLNPSYLRKYKLIKTRVKPAIGIAQDNACQECHTRIPAQTFIEIQKFGSLVTCPRCYRILYAA